MINQYINVCLPLCSNTPSWKKLRWLDSQYSNHLKHSRYSRTPFLGRTIIHVINPYKSLVEKLAKAVVNALCTDQNCTCTSYWQKRPQRSRMNVMGLVSWFSHKKQQLTSALSSGPLQPSCDGAIAADKLDRTERSNRVKLRCMVGNQKVDCKYSKHIRIVIYKYIYIYYNIVILIIPSILTNHSQPITSKDYLTVVYLDQKGPPFKDMGDNMAQASGVVVLGPSVTYIVCTFT